MASSMLMFVVVLIRSTSSQHCKASESENLISCRDDISASDIVQTTPEVWAATNAVY
jgi:hypothetical protein